MLSQAESRAIAEHYAPPTAAAALAQELRSAFAQSVTFRVACDGLTAVFVVDDRQRAWCLATYGVEHTQPAYEQLLEKAIRAAEHGPNRVTELRSGGPPEYYLSSGILQTDKDLAAAWQALGARAISEHVDLIVRQPLRQPTAPTRGEILRMSRDQLDVVLAFVAQEFSSAWSVEVRRAAEQGAVFVCELERQIVGFAAHSGHTAALHTFGPIGVLASARGSGVGAALAHTALKELFARGASCVRVPWVSLEVARFYETICSDIFIEPRCLFSLKLASDA